MEPTTPVEDVNRVSNRRDSAISQKKKRDLNFYCFCAEAANSLIEYNDFEDDAASAERGVM